MLKSELILARIKKQGKRAIPLILPSDYQYLDMANELICLVKSHLGHSRVELTDAIRVYEGDNLDYPIIRGLANILENRCIFSKEPPIDPVKLRNFLFNLGPVALHHNLLNHKITRQQAIAETATHFKIMPEQVEQTIFADLQAERILLSIGDNLTPIDLINRYNLEIARGLLYWAHEVNIIVRDGYKDLFKYIKLFKLMHTVYPIPERGYHVILHGPISPFVKSTIRYGLQFAKFLPAVLLCQSWRMDAEVQLPNVGSTMNYSLDDTTELNSHFKASHLFDSGLEADFAAEFETKYGQGKRTWALAREDEVIVVKDTVMIPDFSLTHIKDGRRALIEIIGFWHPQYLQRKLRKIRQAQRQDLILLIYESANVAKGVFEAISAGEVLNFKNKPMLKKVLELVEKCAVVP